MCVLFSRLLGSSYSAPCVTHRFKELQLLSWLTAAFHSCFSLGFSHIFSLFVTFYSFFFFPLDFSHGFFFLLPIQKAVIRASVCSL